MKTLKLSILFLIPLLLTSCLNLLIAMGPIQRAGGMKIDEPSRVLPAKLKSDIFTDYLWSTPDLKSREIALYPDGNGSFTAETTFGSSTLMLSLDGTGVLNVKSTDNMNSVTSASPVQSANDHYYDVRELSEIVKTGTRWVPKTRMDFETVPVTRFETEFYTTSDAEGHMSTHTRMVPRTVMETHAVMKTDWVWETYTYVTVDIPQYTCYYIPMNDGNTLMFYKTGSAEKPVLWMQNVSFVKARDDDNKLFGQKGVTVLVLDNNLNGYFGDKEDLVMLSSWNPFNKESSYRPLSRIMNNLWYTLSDMENDYFLSFSRNADGSMQLTNLNEMYMGSEEMGTLIIDNQSEESIWVNVNGTDYLNAPPGKKTKYKCQYGQFSLTLSSRKTETLTYGYTLNGQNPEQTIVYSPNDNTGKLTIEGIYSDNWFLEINNNGVIKNYYMKDSIVLPAGSYSIAVIDNGFRLEKEITILSGQTTNIDYESEIKDEGN